MIGGGRLAARGVRLSTLGFGAAPIGGLYSQVDEETAATAVDAAWEAGVRYFDTAPHYGLGQSERRLGATLATRERDSYVISTKVGRLLVPRRSASGLDNEGNFAVSATHRRVWDFSRDGIRRSLDDSLARLGTDRVELLYLHDPEGRMDDALATALPALAELRDEGAVRAIGVGSTDAAALTQAVEDSDIDVIMVAGRYTLLEQPALERLFPACERAGVDVVAAGVFNSGVLASPDPGPDATYDYGTVPRPVLNRARQLADVCAAHGVVLPQAAIQFVLRHRLVRSAVVGMRSAEEVAQNARWLASDVPDTLWDYLSDAALVR